MNEALVQVYPAPSELVLGALNPNREFSFVLINCSLKFMPSLKSGELAFTLKSAVTKKEGTLFNLVEVGTKREWQYFVAYSKEKGEITPPSPTSHDIACSHNVTLPAFMGEDATLPTS
ncbi:MAG: hypothetical protein AAB873_02070 [Patescibacteria group bacterium]